MNIWPYNLKVMKELEAKGLWRPLLGPQALYIHLMGSTPRFREGLFGGARGPGKTEASIALGADRIPNPHYRGLVLRRNARDLADYELCWRRETGIWK